MKKFDEFDWSFNEEENNGNFNFKIGDSVELNNNYFYCTKRFNYESKLIKKSNITHLINNKNLKIEKIEKNNNIELIKLIGYWPWFDAKYWNKK